MADINKTKIEQFRVITQTSITKNSFCWKYFGPMTIENVGKRKYIFENQVFCLPCLQTAQNSMPESLFGSAKIKSYSDKVSTGNLIRHLKDFHGLFEDKNSTTSAANLTSFFNVSRPVKSDSSESTKMQTRKWTLARDLALWFCRSLMPFDSVSNEGLQDFFLKYGIICNNEDLPTRTTISREALTDVYDSMLQHVKQELQRIGTSAAMTTDLWQDQYRRCNYITYTVHFIADDNNSLHNYTLATRVFEGKKTGEALSTYTQNIITSFGLDNKSLTLVTDSGSNVRRISQIIPGLKSHLCLGHGLHNLVMVDGIKNTPQIRNLIVKCKKVVKALRYRLPEIEAEASQEQRRILTEIDGVHDSLEMDENYPLPEESPETSPLLPVEEVGECSYQNAVVCKTTSVAPTIKTATPTRWHSVLAMLESISNKFNQRPINALLSKYNLSELKFNEFEWALINDLCTFLSKFKKIVEILSTDTKSSINLALVLRSEIKDACEVVEEDEKLVMLQIKRNMESMLNHRFPVTKIIVAAALLDCRFCNLKEIDQYLSITQDTRVTFLSNYIREVIPAAEIDKLTAEKSCQESEKNYLMHLAHKHADAGNNEDAEHIEKECLKYLVACDVSDLIHGDVIKYWLDRKLTFPLLFRLAKIILCIPATSTPSERVFSISGLTVTAKRSRLSPANVDKIIFVHDNYTNCKNVIK